MIIITLGNEKGGDGKSTLALALAYGLANLDLRVLVLDTDPQANATLALGIQKQPRLYDLLVREAGWSESIVSVDSRLWSTGKTITGRLAIVPGNIETRGIPDYVSGASLLRERLDQLTQVFDVVVIDTPPTPSLLHALVYEATDCFIGVTRPEYFSLQQLASTLGHIDAFNTRHTKQIEVIGIQPTFFRGVTLEHRDNLAALIERYGKELVWEPIAEAIVWAEASRAHMPVGKYAPGQQAVDQAKGFVDRVWEKVYGKQTT